MNIYLLIPLTSFFISLFVAIAVFFSDSKNRLNRIFSLYVASIVWWSITEYLMRSSSDVATALYWSKIFSLGSIFMAPLFLTFAVFFTRNALIHKKWFYLVFYVPIILIAFLGYTTNIFTIPTMRLEYWGWHYVEGPFFPITMILPFSYIILGLYLIWRFYKSSANKNERKQSQLFLVGVTFSLTVSGLTQSPLPFIGALVPLGTLSTAIKSCIYAFAMLKYRLLVIPPTVAMKTIFNNIRDMIITINPDKTIATINPATTEILNYDRQELIGKPAKEIFTDTNLFDEMEWLKALRESSVKNLRMNLLNKQGEKIPISFSGSVIRDRGEIVGLVSISTDMRETDKLIHELESSKKELNTKVEELESFSKMAVGREIKMIELKRKIREFEEDKNKS